MSPKKRVPFDVTFVSLGVQIDFSETHLGKVLVTNKPGRLDNIKSAIMEVFAKGELGFKEALSIKGKISYAEGQLFSRVAAPACRVLSKWAGYGGRRKLTSELISVLSEAGRALSVAGPRQVSVRCVVPPVVVFTDGACEESGTSVGGVIFCDQDRPELFGAVVTNSVVQEWCSKVGQKQVIGQAELFPLLVARLTWKEKLSGRKVIYFIDNDSARLGLIKAYSPVLSSLEIISKCLSWDHIHRSSSWFARVPTASNIADDPSRMDPSLLIEKFGARIVSPVGPVGGEFSSVL